MKYKMRNPRAVDLEITQRCNLRCNYCSFFTSASDVEQDLPTKEWLVFFEELNRCAVTHVTLSGGEAFCREDLCELIDGIVHNRMRFNILSNGTLITNEMAKFISSTGRCNGVQISIDGAAPKTHDSYRGKGNFYKAMKGIKFLLKHNITAFVRVTIHRQNVRDLENITKLLLEDIGLTSFSTNSASYLGLCRRNSQQVQLTVEERNLAMETLLKLNQKFNGRINAAAGPLAEAQNWLTMEKNLKERKENVSGRGHLSGCNGVFSRIAVRADGIIVPCSVLSHIELGRINHDDLQKIWQNHHELKRLGDRHNKSLSDFEFCSGCTYINYCTGGCPGMAYTIMNDHNHPSSDSCLRLFYESGGILPNSELFIE